LADLKQYLQSRRQQMLEEVDALVRMESPTGDKQAVDRVGDALQMRLEKSGLVVQRFPRAEAGDLRLGWLPGASEQAKFLLLCHMDTVWPVGSVADRPPQSSGGRYIAPGAADMKGGLVVALNALQAVQALGQQPAGTVQILLTSDEETGSRAARGMIEELAGQSQLVLCLEPGMPDGSLKTARKGGMTVCLTTHGRAAHAGAQHRSGINAVEEMAHHILALQRLTEYDRGTTVSVGKIQGGLGTNVVPPECRAWFDMRIMVPEERLRLEAEIAALQPRLAGATLEATISPGRPPMPRDAKMAAVFHAFQQIGARYGLSLTEASTGGASDANFAAALGVPVIDGLGPAGGELHAVGEYIEIDSLIERTILLAAVLLEWEF
jgi:glutamate carboxypeptidase